MSYIHTIVLFIFAFTTCSVTAMESCPKETLVNRSFSYSINVDSDHVTHKLLPEYFGFNLEWVGFQWSLWDVQKNVLRPEVASYLKAFPGAVYRYPGGTIANEMNWRDVIGAPDIRPKKNYVPWMQPFVAKFGLKEYLNFVKQVNGKAWYVANIYGNVNEELSSSILSEEAGELAKYIHHYNETETVPIFRWELGNELDRGQYKWSPEKIAKVSEIVASKIQSNDQNAKFVSLMQEYDAQAEKGIRATEYNQRIAKNLNHLTDEFAMHVYYDGKPGGQPIPSRIKAICDAISEAKLAIPQSSPSIWVTEHARVPPNAWVDPNWKKSWPRTADLEAAIGVTDLMIAGTQIPALKGAFIHSLHGTSGPWPLFHLNKSATEIHPSVVYWALKMMRESMLENVLPTTTFSRNKSGYDGGYDLRATVMTNSDHTKYSIWAINRSGKQVNAQLGGSMFINRAVSAQNVMLSDENELANNYINASRVNPIIQSKKLSFDNSGSTTVIFPPYSVNTIIFSID
jgi:alpha-L-arabinofuranosidase